MLQGSFKNLWVYGQEKVSANTPVVANDDFAGTFKMTPTEINVTKNDYGIGSGIRGIEITVPPIHGTAAITEHNTILYKPENYFIGSDSFVYRICNTSGYCGAAKVFVNVDDYDFVPVAHNDTVISYQIKNLTIDVLNNDEYLYDLPISIDIITNFNNSTATVDNDFRIVPNINRYSAEGDSLLYRVCDKEGDCDQAWLFLSLDQDVEQVFFIPEGFSPNGDGINDTFTIPDFQDVANMVIYIYDRTGVLLYEDQQFNNNWDGYANTGSYKGKRLESGAYYYLIQVDGIGDFKGFIYLSR
ncbi:copper amine oxidase N- domain superfamily [Geofilum rubicundum JCM 15548]|uniref:Copper amine oxidase N-domain superfamily n=1 Tax=Geofilum rubicundum JCM 15548 TaxID=1236989 RepID=A0A0E9M2S6_9BACT|nr:copper amine oxidase N- domain superfamily [Geofilum rubicundum JCM 15548]